MTALLGGTRRMKPFERRQGVMVLVVYIVAMTDHVNIDRGSVFFN